jgi:hypothetical protein
VTPKEAAAWRDIGKRKIQERRKMQSMTIDQIYAEYGKLSLAYSQLATENHLLKQQAASFSSSSPEDVAKRIHASVKAMSKEQKDIYRNTLEELAFQDDIPSKSW